LALVGTRRLGAGILPGDVGGELAAKPGSAVLTPAPAGDTCRCVLLERQDGLDRLDAGIGIEHRLPFVVEEIDAILGSEMLPGIGRPEAARRHEADAGDAF